MTQNPKLDWPAQSPSPDFAARAVAAILRDRNEHRGRLAQPLLERSGAARRNMRWLAIAAAAAMTMAGGAFAWTALPRAAKLPAMSGSTEVRPRAIEALRPGAPTTIASAHEIPRRPTAPPAMSPPRRKETASMPSSSAPELRRRVIVPRCNCQDALCACLEAH